MNNEVPSQSGRMFYVGNVALIIAAAAIVYFSSRPLQLGACIVMTLCVLAGALLSIIPWMQEYKAALRLSETTRITTAMEQISSLETVSSQIGSAISTSQQTQEQCAKSLKIAQEVTERTAAEAKALGEMMRKVNESDRSRLALELEKQKRMEGDWVETMVRLLDHVYALQQAGARSGQPELAHQLTRFQGACYDSVRRVGIVAFGAAPGDPFNAEAFQTENPDAQPAAGEEIERTLATGYKYQGQMIRRALVKIKDRAAESGVSEPDTKSETKPEPVAQEKVMSVSDNPDTAMIETESSVAESMPEAPFEEEFIVMAEDGVPVEPNKADTSAEAGEKPEPYLTEELDEQGTSEEQAGSANRNQRRSQRKPDEDKGPTEMELPL